MKAIKVLILVLMTTGLFIPLFIKAVYAAKSLKPEYVLQSALKVVADDVATLDTEVAGLSSQANQIPSDFANIQASNGARPRTAIVVDANGQQFGDVLLGNFVVGFETSVGLVGVWFNRAGWEPESSSLFFLDPDCQGQGYAEPYWAASGVPEAFIWEGQLLVVDQTQQTIDLGDSPNAWRAGGDGSCSPWNQNRRLYPAIPVAEVPDFQLPVRATTR